MMIFFRGFFVLIFFSAFADDDTDSVATPIGFKRRKLEANLRVQTGQLFSDDEDADEFSPSRRFLYGRRKSGFRRKKTKNHQSATDLKRFYYTIVCVLLGYMNPSSKTAETQPLLLEQTRERKNKKM